MSHTNHINNKNIIHRSVGFRFTGHEASRETPAGLHRLRLASPVGAPSKIAGWELPELNNGKIMGKYENNSENHRQIWKSLINGGYGGL
jgi:hypothetical protein